MRPLPLLSAAAALVAAAGVASVAAPAAEAAACRATTLDTGAPRHLGAVALTGRRAVWTHGATGTVLRTRPLTAAGRPAGPRLSRALGGRIAPLAPVEVAGGAVLVARHTPAGGGGAPAVVAWEVGPRIGAPRAIGTHGATPAAAPAADGTVWAAWAEAAGDGYRIVARQRTAPATWGDPHLAITLPVGTVATAVRIQPLAGGRLLLVWDQRPVAGATPALAAMVIGTDGFRSAPVAIGGEGGHPGGSLRLGGGPAGGWLAWIGSDGVRLLGIDRDGRSGEVRTVSTTGGVAHAGLILGAARGRWAPLAWSERRGAGRRAPVMLLDTATGALRPWATPRVHAGDGRPTATVDGGRVAVLWRAPGQSADTLRMLSGPLSGTGARRAAAVRLPTPARGAPPRAALHLSGRGVVTAIVPRPAPAGRNQVLRLVACGP